MAGQTNTRNAVSELSMILGDQPELYDLHTHLLGMGNADFWVDTILMNKNVMPTNDEFIYDESIRQKFCPLIWDRESNTGFVDGTEAAQFFSYLYQENILPVEEDNILPRDESNTESDQKSFSDVIKDLEKKFSPVLCKLISEDFNRKLLHQGLCFKDNFSYDVVLTLSDLAKGLGIKQTDGIGFEQHVITDKLMGYSSSGPRIFQDYIYFNARKQEFDIECGIQVEHLRKLITVDPDKPSEAAKLARAHINNAFSMCDAQGTPARPVDFHSFQGSFTTEFYPRRFALKDSIYSQRLDVLAVLIEHISERYLTALPPVTYCELSIGVSDLSKPWIFDVLRSIGTYLQRKNIQNDEKDLSKHTFIASKEVTSFSQIVLNGHFPHLQNIFTKSEFQNTGKPPFTYKFLAGFNRRNVAYPLTQNQNDALRLLSSSPQRAMLIMMEEIAKSKREATTAERTPGPFDHFIDQITRLETNGETMPSFYEWVVGLDLHGDELGYPYCPFVARPFINYVLRQRSKANERFGVRIHCGENVIFADDDSPTYRLFIAHMYIVFRCLRFLQCELKYGIRVGHGIAFDHILGRKMSRLRYRKSSVLLAEMREHANYLFKNVAFEVNITANEYLLGQTLRQEEFGEVLRLDALLKAKAKIILSTDDDGIWPIDQCQFAHPGHHSLPAEYCRAISNSLIKTPEQLEDILKTTKDFCFWNQRGELQKMFDEDYLLPDDKWINSIIIHPSIVKLIHEEYMKTLYPVHPALRNFKIYSGNDSISKYNIDINWTNLYGAIRVAFICACFPHSNDNEIEMETIRQEYCNLFQNAEYESKKRVEEEFDFIYANWKNIRSEFVFPKQDKQRSRSSKNVSYIEMVWKNQRPTANDVQYVVYSEPESQNVTKEKSLHEIFIDFLQQFRHRKVRIWAFAQEMDIEKTIEAINMQVNNKNNIDMYKDVTVTIYTNPNKYKYAYSTINHRFKLWVNPKSSMHDYTNENFLYVLCPHASAATLAVHLISEQLSETVIHCPITLSENDDANSTAEIVIDYSITLSENDDANPTAATEPYTSKDDLKDGNEEKNIEEQLQQKYYEENSCVKKQGLEEEMKPSSMSVTQTKSENQNIIILCFDIQPPDEIKPTICDIKNFINPFKFIATILSIKDKTIYVISSINKGHLVLPLIYKHFCVEKIYVCGSTDTESSSTWSSISEKLSGPYFQVQHIYDQILYDIARTNKESLYWNRNVKDFIMLYTQQLEYRHSFIEILNPEPRDERVIIFHCNDSKLFSMNHKLFPTSEFTDEGQCVELIKTLTQSQIFLIISGSMIPLQIQLSFNLQQIHGIYFFRNNEFGCLDNKRKVSGLFYKQDDLYEQLHSHILFYRQQYNHIPRIDTFQTIENIGKAMSHLNDQQTAFLTYNLFMDILSKIPLLKFNLEDFINICNTLYSNVRQEIVHFLNRIYEESNDVMNIIKDPLFSQIVLRLHQHDQLNELFILQKPLVAIQKRISESSKASKTITVYLTKIISNDTLETMKSKNGELISIGIFIIASKSLVTARTIAREMINNGLIPILFQIDVIQGTPLLEIDSDRVLLNLCAAFRLQSIDLAPDNIWYAKLASADADLQFIKEQLQLSVQAPLSWLTFGNYLYFLHQSERSKDYFEYLLNKLLEKHTMEPNEAIAETVECSPSPKPDSTPSTVIQTTDNVLPKINIDRSTVLGNIADVYYQTEDYQSALKYYEKALELSGDLYCRFQYQQKILTVKQFIKS